MYNNSRIQYPTFKNVKYKNFGIKLKKDTFTR
jgi:hypothetical protein